MELMHAAKYDALFQPVALGEITLPNRIVMAPLTRARATAENVPTAMMACYYAQRADCGLIVSEATAVDPLGMGWYRVPGIWNAPMVEGSRSPLLCTMQAGGYSPSFAYGSVGPTRLYRWERLYH